MPRYDLDNTYRYHAPHGDQTQRYERIRAEGKALAQTIVDAAPESAERTLALRKIEEAVMWANASIARNEPEASSETASQPACQPQR